MNPSIRRLAHVLFSVVLPTTLSISVGLIDSPAGAAEHWVPLGPIGGRVDLLAQGRSDPSRLYAATSPFGLFRSRDGGRSWQSILHGFRGGYLAKLAVAPSDPDIVLAATTGDSPYHQIWHSEDGGSTWNPAQRPPARDGNSLPVNDLMIASGAPQTAYAATDQGIFRSLDGGATWDSWALPNVPISAIAQSERAPATFFAAGHDASDFHGAIYRSEDGGLTWFERSGGPGWETVPDRLFFNAGILYAKWNFVLYLSTDGASNWTRAASLPRLPALDFAIAPSGAIYAATEAGVYVSTDGDHWSPPEVTTADLATPRDGLSHLAIGSGGPRAGSETVIAGGRRGFWRSTDQGGSWRAASRGIAVHEVEDLAVMANPQGTVLASLDDGLYRIDRGGETWQRLPNQADFQFEALAADPHHAGRIYAFGVLDVSVSEDRGNRWRKVGSLPYNGILFFKVDPVHPDVLYASITQGGGSSTFGYAYRSVDGGATWTTLPGIEYLFGLAFDRSRPNVGYRLTDHGIDRSRDGGEHWTPIPRHDDQLGEFPSAILVDARSHALYVGTDNRGIFRSTDSGRTFRRIVGGLPRLPGGRYPAVGTLVQDAGGDVYAGLGFAGVFRLAPGEGWKAVGSDLPLATFTGQTLVADPSVPGLLYAGSLGSGVLRLENR